MSQCMSSPLVLTIFPATCCHFPQHWDVQLSTTALGGRRLLTCPIQWARYQPGQQQLFHVQRLIAEDTSNPSLQKTTICHQRSYHQGVVCSSEQKCAVIFKYSRGMLPTSLQNEWKQMETSTREEAHLPEWLFLIQMHMFSVVLWRHWAVGGPHDWLLLLQELGLFFF